MNERTTLVVQQFAGKGGEKEIFNEWEEWQRERVEKSDVKPSVITHI